MKGALVAAKPSGSVHAIIRLDHALRRAGTPENVLDAIIEDEDIANAASEAAIRAFQAKYENAEVLARQKTLWTPLEDTKFFTTRTLNLLRGSGIKKVGDLFMKRLDDLLDIKRFGATAKSEVEEFVAHIGLRMLEYRQNPMKHAIQLFGGAEHVPSTYLVLWTSGIEGRTKDVLVRYETLGQLCQLSEARFVLAEYGYLYAEDLAVPKVQWNRVRSGLHRAGLAPSAE